MRRAERALPVRHAVALGLLQGPTELLPVSSSAHTTLLPWLAGWDYEELDDELRKGFEVALHGGTAAALALLAGRELAADASRIWRSRPAVLVLALTPAAVAGLALGGTVERELGSPVAIALALTAGSAGMLAAELRSAAAARGGRAVRVLADASAGDGLALGLAQAVALIPGISRSGATIGAARWRGFARAGRTPAVVGRGAAGDRGGGTAAGAAVAPPGGTGRARARDGRRCRGGLLLDPRRRWAGARRHARVPADAVRALPWSAGRCRGAARGQAAIAGRWGRAAMPVIGDSIGGRYRLEAVVGRGGMSTVYRAFDTVLERPVAIKLMHPSVAADAAQLERFRREARLVARLSHPHVVTVIDAGEQPPDADGDAAEDSSGHPYIVFEYVEGETLKELIRREGPLEIPRAVAYALELARALGAAHAHDLVHRDVKPQNVLITDEGRPRSPTSGSPVRSPRRR